MKTVLFILFIPFSIKVAHFNPILFEFIPERVLNIIDIIQSYWKDEERCHYDDSSEFILGESCKVDIV